MTIRTVCVLTIVTIIGIGCSGANRNTPENDSEDTFDGQGTTGDAENSLNPGADADSDADADTDADADADSDTDMTIDTAPESTSDDDTVAGTNTVRDTAFTNQWSRHAFATFKKAAWPSPRSIPLANDFISPRPASGLHSMPGCSTPSLTIWSPVR